MNYLFGLHKEDATVLHILPSLSSPTFYYLLSLTIILYQIKSPIISPKYSLCLSVFMGISLVLVPNDV